VISGNPTVVGTYPVTITVTDPVDLSTSESFTWTITSTPAPNPHRPALTNPGDQSTPVTEHYGYAGAVLAANPVGYWRLDDYGTTVRDWAAMPHDGTVHGGVTRLQPGALADGSPSMGFDGQPGTYVNVSDVSAVDVSTAVTVEAWANTDLVQYGAIVERRTSTGLAYRLLYGDNRITFRIEGDIPGGAAQIQVAPQPADVNAWVHLAGTFDGTTLRLYRNGAEVGSAAVVGTLRTGGGTLCIGSDGTTFALTGQVDEVAVYPTALSAAQIAAHYALRGTASTVSLQLIAADSDGDPLMYSATGLPPGLEVHPLTGVISGNPTAVGVYPITVTVTDPVGLSTSESFTWTITPPVQVAVTSPADGAVFALGATIVLQASASSAGSLVGVDFYADSTLIGSAAQSPYTLAWTPSSASTYTLTAIATDTAGRSATSLAVHVSVASAPCTYALSPATVTSPAAGASGTIAVTTASGCAWTASSSQEWVTLGAIAGVGAGTIGYSVAANTGGSRSATMTIAGATVIVSQEAGGPPAIASVTPDSGAAGTEVTISGTGFGSVQGGGSVWLGTRTATVISWTETAIVATVSNGSQTGTVQVRRSDAASNELPFTWRPTALRISAI
jgi:hypothetical protein